MHLSLNTDHCACKLRHPHGSRKLPRIETELPQRATGGVRTKQAQDRRLRPLWRCPPYFKQRNLAARPARTLATNASRAHEFCELRVMDDAAASVPVKVLGRLWMRQGQEGR